jgi:predicted PurR-regulated permease PerM
VVISLVGAAIAVVGAVIEGIVSQSGNVLAEIQKGLVEAGFADGTATDITSAVEGLQLAVASDYVEALISGISSLSGFIGGVLLGILIMYYLLKDGAALRATTLERMRADRAEQFDAFVGDACTVLRQYWLGRTLVSAIVAGVVGLASWMMGLPMIGTPMAVTFVDGYIRTSERCSVAHWR